MILSNRYFTSITKFKTFRRLIKSEFVILVASPQTLWRISIDEMLIRAAITDIGFAGFTVIPFSINIISFFASNTVESHIIIVWSEGSPHNWMIVFAYHL